jgi:hypothetical protein
MLDKVKFLLIIYNVDKHQEIFFYRYINENAYKIKKEAALCEGLQS